MKLFLKEHEAALDKAGDRGNKAIVRIFNPCGGQTWIVYGQDPRNKDRLWAACDLGFGCVELGTVWRHDLEDMRTPPLGLPLERDLHWKPGRNIEVYSGLESISSEPPLTPSELKEKEQKEQSDKGRINMDDLTAQIKALGL